MNNRYHFSRILFYFVLALIMFTNSASSCEGNQSPRETMTALKEQAEEAGFVVPAGAYAFFSDAQQVAIFLAPAEGQNGTYLLAAIVDTNHVYLLNAQTKFAEWGLQGKIALGELVMCLKARGFTELTAGTTPTLIATLRLAWGFLKSQGAKAIVATSKLGEAIELIVMPAGLVQPAWCLQNPFSCESVER